MGLYDKYILPKAIHWACQIGPAMQQRAKVIPQARGEVLEIGIGSGHNLEFYDSEKVRSVIGVDPSLETWKEHDVSINDLNFHFQYVQAFAQDLPFENNAFDSVVITYSLCSIHEHEKIFTEIRRVLKPTGFMHFCEHGKAPDKWVERWQNWITPIWKRFGGGCHLNKDIPKIITDHGMSISRLNEDYIPGWKPASFNYWGHAQVR
jgi:ubiquinone/menaquinone biosynthesis C-methylase UbiE